MEEAGVHQPPVQRATVAHQPSHLCSGRARSRILSAFMRVFLNVRGRNTVPSVMSRRNVHMLEALVGLLCGSVAVVAHRLFRDLEQLKDQRSGIQQHWKAGEAEAQLHTAA